MDPTIKVTIWLMEDLDKVKFRIPLSLKMDLVPMDLINKVTVQLMEDLDMAMFRIPLLLKADLVQEKAQLQVRSSLPNAHLLSLPCKAHLVAIISFQHLHNPLATRPVLPARPLTHPMLHNALIASLRCRVAYQ